MNAKGNKQDYSSDEEDENSSLPLFFILSLPPSTCSIIPGPGGCGFDACEQFGISDKRAHAVFFAARADKFNILRRVIGRKLNYTVFLEQSAKRFILRDASLLEIDYVIGAAVEGRS